MGRLSQTETHSHRPLSPPLESNEGTVGLHVYRLISVRELRMPNN